MDIKKMRINGKKPSDAVMEEIITTIKDRLNFKGIESYVYRVNSSQLRILGCRLSAWYMERFGGNSDKHTQYGKYDNRDILGWDDWCIVNNTVNEILDEFDVNAIATSLGGRIKIRTDDNWTEDYDEYKYDNVGSFMYPCYRRDKWESNGIGRDGWRRYTNPEQKEGLITNLLKEFDNVLSKGNSFTQKDARYFGLLLDVQDIVLEKCKTAKKKRIFNTMKKLFFKMTSVKNRATGLSIML